MMPSERVSQGELNDAKFISSFLNPPPPPPPPVLYRGTGSLLLRTVHKLQGLKSRHPSLELLVPGILAKLLQEHLSQDDSPAISADTHLLCWSYDEGGDVSSAPDSSKDVSGEGACYTRSQSRWGVW